MAVTCWTAVTPCHTWYECGDICLRSQTALNHRHFRSRPPRPSGLRLALHTAILKSMALRIHNRDDEDHHDDEELRQTDPCEHGTLSRGWKNASVCGGWRPLVGHGVGLECRRTPLMPIAHQATRWPRAPW